AARAAAGTARGPVRVPVRGRGTRRALVADARGPVTPRVRLGGTRWGSVRVMRVGEANEAGSEGGKRSDDRRGVPEGTPQEGGASTPLAAPGSFAADAMITRTAS